VITQVDNTTESLPILAGNTKIGLHYTAPAQEVLQGGSEVGQVFDIDTLDLEDIDYNLELKIGETTKVSISYDPAKVGDDQAGEFLSKVKSYLDDPELLLFA